MKDLKEFEAIAGLIKKPCLDSKLRNATMDIRQKDKTIVEKSSKATVVGIFARQKP